MLFCQAEVRFNGMLPGRFRFCVKYSERCRKRGGAAYSTVWISYAEQKNPAQQRAEQGLKRVDQGKSGSFRRGAAAAVWVRGDALRCYCSFLRWIRKLPASAAEPAASTTTHRTRLLSSPVAGESGAVEGAGLAVGAV